MRREINKSVQCEHTPRIIYSRDIADLFVSLSIPSSRREREDRGFLFSMERDRTNEEEEEIE